MKKSKRFIALCKKYGVDPEKVPEVLTFESACKAVGVSPKKLPGVSHLPVRHRKRLVADYKLTIVAEALRGGKKANYNDSGEFKYFPASSSSLRRRPLKAITSPTSLWIGNMIRPRKRS